MQPKRAGVGDVKGKEKGTPGPIMYHSLSVDPDRDGSVTAHVTRESTARKRAGAPIGTPALTISFLVGR